ncbi:DUF4113 domain-containing protein [Pantoea sp. Tr-811]|uniref:DUF4113 domain-containing protein n=1 Tax=Pantoea sp. Tr-811 TaxID=2608361 RepID=UPI001962D15F
MGVLDAVNRRWGRGTVRLASVPSDPSGGMRREMMSQSFTTRVDELRRFTAINLSKSPEQTRTSLTGSARPGWYCDDSAPPVKDGQLPRRNRLPVGQAVYGRRGSIRYRLMPPSFGGRRRS